MAGTTVERVDGSAEPAATTAGLLARLPAWFGRPEANAGYAEAARRLPGYLARDDGGATVGLLLQERHCPEAAEIHLMAVDPARHRRGTGTALLAALEREPAADGCRMLHVKTLGPGHPDAGYAAPRAFCRAAGFGPLEETLDLWPATPCLLPAKPLPAVTPPPP